MIGPDTDPDPSKKVRTFKMLHPEEGAGFFLADGSGELGGVLVQRFSEIFDEGLYDSVNALFGIPHLKGRRWEGRKGGERGRKRW